MGVLIIPFLQVSPSFTPPKILSAGTPNCRGVQAAVTPLYHDEGIALVSRVVSRREEEQPRGRRADRRKAA